MVQRTNVSTSFALGLLPSGLATLMMRSPTLSRRTPNFPASSQPSGPVEQAMLDQ